MKICSWESLCLAVARCNLGELEGTTVHAVPLILLCQHTYGSRKPEKEQKKNARFCEKKLLVTARMDIGTYEYGQSMRTNKTKTTATTKIHVFEKGLSNCTHEYSQSIGTNKTSTTTSTKTLFVSPHPHPHPNKLSSFPIRPHKMR